MNPSLREFGAIKLATPCSMKWADMTGDERARHCAKCRLNVYNVEALTADEVRSLVLKTEGRLCFNFLVRKDGTVLTKDCPVGLAAVKRRMYLAFAATVLLATGFVANLLNALGMNQTACATIGTSTAVVQKLDLKAKVIRALLPSEPQNYAGGIRAVPYRELTKVEAPKTTPVR